MKQYIISIRIVLLMAVLGGLVVSCKKMDDYKKYAEGGEIVYPATFDSLKVIPGNYRVMITGFLAGIPNITRFRVYWNDGLDSLESSIIRKGKVDTIRQIIANLPEGPKTFTIRTYDDKGNRSIPMTITGNVYGANFQKSVDERGNRNILGSIVNTNGAAEISWANVDAYVGVRGMHIHYFDLNNQEYDFIEPMKGKDQVTTLPDINLYKPITYNTLYLPDTVGIDTFTVPVKTLPAFKEITLLNSVYPVANRANDGNRWATPRDWTLNAAAMNQKDSKGVYYGGTSIGDKKIYFEAGWGASAISNGKIHQVVTLAPGNYSFEGDIDWWSVGSKNDTYLTVAIGTNGLPDVSNISNAFSYKRVDNGSRVITTFTLTRQTTLSLGLVLDLADDGEAMRFNSLRLYIK
ncbi:hypothetical protein A4H97_25330 [Niastella yeongjuensis]|uniref:DUF5013 domain-containing protein n=1 Tax=Niastella yeongjuensis TaxID=354355 RepID=A0A1V9F306_9BACT|nr:DUF4998 domain-containing protein [Niastella yeongjuensis]OQP52645.1 hypothetical protein A4H97_25330 [Niastella yeongjuensis]SEP33155.1 protein of unknown function [Niastella yeongjuensis]